MYSTSIPGNQRLITDYRHGRLAPADDAESFARVIGEQWAQFEQATRMACAARQRVKEEFSIQTVARKHLELFRTLTRTLS